MTANKGSVYMLSLTSVVFCLVLISSVAIRGEPAPPQRTGIPEDWSHHHLIFSDPGTYGQAIANGTITKWINLRYDPRFILQQMKRNRALQSSRITTDLEVNWRWRRRSPTPWHRTPSSHLERDWSMSMGSGGSVSVGAGQAPAKYSFSDTTAFCDSNATPDYVVYNTSTAGASNQASIIAYDNLYSGCTGFHPLGYWAYNTNGGTIVSSPVLSLDGSQVAFMQSVNNVASVVLLKWSKSASSTASSPLQLTTSTSSVMVTGCSWTTSSTTINCTGGNFSTAFDVGAPISGGGLSNETITAVGSAAQITISPATTNTGSNQTLNVTPQYTTNVAASGCSWNVATNSTVTCTSGGFTAAADVGAALVGFNAGFPNGETITVVNSSTNFTVSPALPTSGGGSSGLGASGTIYALSSTVVAPSNYHSCAAPCMTSIALSGSPNDTNSSQFYDYNNDVLYVGDNSGVLHKFTNIFVSGTPAEILGGGTTSGWPQTISANSLTSPVFDLTTGNVFVASGNGGSTGAELHYIPSTGGSSNIVSSASLGKNGIVDAPIVDSTAARVYVFLSQDNNSSGSGFAAVYQFTTTFASGGAGTEKTLGQGNGGASTSYDGMFDNTYFSSSSGSSPSGNLYVCGTSSSGGSVPMLYQVPINSNAMGTPLAGPALSTGNVNCSPISEVYNTTATGGPFDWIFLSVAGNGEGNCSVGNNGCVIGFAVTGWLASTTYTTGQGIVDSNFNIEKVTAAGTSSSSQPTWSATVGGTTTDGTATWTNEGPLTLTGFTATHIYTSNTVIVDSNGNLERVTAVAGVSGGSAPLWNTTFGGTTTSGLVTFTNQGFGASSLIATKGTSAIISDNSVATVTLAGASQVYFSPLSSQACAGNNGPGSTGQGMGGCAVQASQSGLQ